MRGDIVPKKNSAIKPIPSTKLKEDVRLWLKDNDLFYDTAIYNAAEWKKRGERYGDGATLVITTEGPLHGILNHYYGTKHAYDLEEGFIQFLSKRGYWYDLGESWMILIYKL